VKTISVYCNNTYVIASGYADTCVFYTKFSNDFVFVKQRMYRSKLHAHANRPKTPHNGNFEKPICKSPYEMITILDKSVWAIYHDIFGISTHIQ